MFREICELKLLMKSLQRGIWDSDVVIGALRVRPEQPRECLLTQGGSYGPKTLATDAP